MVGVEHVQGHNASCSMNGNELGPFSLLWNDIIEFKDKKNVFKVMIQKSFSNFKLSSMLSNHIKSSGTY